MSRDKVYGDKNFIRSIVIVALFGGVSILTSGCAYETRSGSPQISSSDLVQIYNEIESGGATVSAAGSNGTAPTGGTTVNQGLLAQDQNAIPFYVESDNSRPVTSVLAFDDMSVLSSVFGAQTPGWMPVESVDVQHVDVIFVDGDSVDNSGNPYRSYELLMKFAGSQGTAYSIWTSAPGTDDFSDGLFSVEMDPQTGGGSAILLETHDFDSNDNFNSGVKFKVLDSTGSPAGQISTMLGYF